MNAIPLVIILGVLLAFVLVGWFFRPQTSVPAWIAECRKLGEGRRRQAEFADEERLRAQREAALATLRERGWLLPEVERVVRP